MKWHLARSAQYFGTGDIVDPPPSVRQLEDTRGDEIAAMVFEGKLDTPGKIKKLADQLKVEPWQIESLKLSPAVQRALEQRVRALALEKMKGIIEAHAEKGKDDVQSAAFVAKTAEILRTGGGGVTVNTAVGVDNSRQGGDSKQQVAFIETMRDRQLVVLKRNMNGNGSDSSG